MDRLKEPAAARPMRLPAADHDHRTPSGRAIIDKSPRALAVAPLLQAMRRCSAAASPVAGDPLTHRPAASGPGVAQKVERRTTIFGRNQQTWHKNMQIIDSTSPDDYVHLSRSTTTDPQTFNNNAQPPNSVVTPNDVNKREVVEDAPNAVHTFPRNHFTPANNVHVTLEGRYMTVMHHLATELWDNTVQTKAGPPVVNFTNLNFGDLHDTPQLSEYSIYTWIDLAADEAIDHLRANTAGDLPEGARSDVLTESINDVCGVVDRVRDSTKAFTTRLIDSVPAFQEMEDRFEFGHYGGEPWRIRF